MLKTAFVFASLLVAIAQATVLDASFKVDGTELHGATVSGRVHVTLPAGIVDEAFDWLLDGDVWRRDDGNGVMADVRSGVNTFAFADGEHIVSVRNTKGVESPRAVFHVRNTAPAAVEHAGPVAAVRSFVRSFSTLGFLKGKKKKKNNITGYDQFGNPIYNNNNSNWHNNGVGSSNGGLNNGNFGSHGGFDAQIPGGYNGFNGQGNQNQNVGFNDPGFNNNGFNSGFNNGFNNPGFNNPGFNDPGFSSNNAFNDPSGGFGGDAFGGSGGAFGAATTVLNPVTGQQVTISDSTLNNCRMMNMAYYSVITDSCTNQAFTNGQQNTPVGVGNTSGGNGWNTGFNSGTREGEPECVDASETCIPSLCMGTPGAVGNGNLAPGFIAPGVKAECTNGSRCTSFTDPSNHDCPFNYRPCCENPGFSRTTWIVIGVCAAAFVLVVVVAVSIRARNVGRSAELGNMRSLMHNMDSSDSSIFLSNSIQRNPARY